MQNSQGKNTKKVFKREEYDCLYNDVNNFNNFYDYCN